MLILLDNECLRHRSCRPKSFSEVSISAETGGPPAFPQHQEHPPPLIHLLNLFKNLVAFPATILIDWHLSPLSLRTPGSYPKGALCAPRLKTLVSKLETRLTFKSGRRGHNLVTGVRDRLCNPVRRDGLRIVEANLAFLQIDLDILNSIQLI